MKKRNTDGFALIYVVVVIFILCAIALALMSATLRTLQAQEASIRRMKDKYAAQGEIERLVAELAILGIGDEADDFGDEEAAKTAGEHHIISKINTFDKSAFQEYTTIPDSGNTFSITAVDGQISITATISVCPSLRLTSYSVDVQTGTNATTGAPEYTTETRWKYIVNGSDLDFISYKITSVEEGETE